MKMSGEIQGIYIGFLVRELKLLGAGYYNCFGFNNLGPIEEKYILRKYENV